MRHKYSTNNHISLLCPIIGGLNITYREKFGHIYKEIVNNLKDLGYKVEATHALKHKVDEINRHTDEQRLKDYEEMMDWIKEAEVVVCEVSFPSTVTTGHVITRALEQGRPVLALYHKGKRSTITSWS